MRLTYKHEFSPIQRFFQKALGMWRINQDSIDFSWGYFAPRFGFEFTINKGGYFDRRLSLDLCLIWGKIHIRFPINVRDDEVFDFTKFGFNTHSSSFWLLYGKEAKCFDLPFFSMVFDGHWILDKNQNWRKIERGERSWEVLEKEGYFESHPYTYVLKSGEIQKRVATCSVQRRQWHRKWFPFLKLKSKVIDITFDGEVGERTGSWKGGTTGCSYEMIPGETIEMCLRRMEIAREF